MRTAALIAAVGLAAPLGFAARSQALSLSQTVPCSASVHRARFPYLGDPGYRYRLVLGAVSVPPAYLRQVIATGNRPWRYWHKAGLVVRASGQAVTVSVPRAWRARVAITWGNTGIVHSLRIAGCGHDPSQGNAYAGGLYLRSTSACVPLVFSVGTRSSTVRFGVGRRCSR